ncbi:MAG: hypothetical protein GXO26_09085 [Crenarchaeota archaeon]|nr:hypothetical protein [Thermoproteota archaeon]
MTSEKTQYQDTVASSSSVVRRLLGLLNAFLKSKGPDIVSIVREVCKSVETGVSGSIRRFSRVEVLKTFYKSLMRGYLYYKRSSVLRLGIVLLRSGKIYDVEFTFSKEEGKWRLARSCNCTSYQAGNYCGHVTLGLLTLAMLEESNIEEIEVEKGELRKLMGEVKLRNPVLDLEKLLRRVTYLRLLL